MGYTIAEIAAHTGLSAEGDLSLSVVRPSEPSDAARDELALAMSRQYEEAVAACQAQAAVLWPGADRNRCPEKCG